MHDYNPPELDFTDSTLTLEEKHLAVVSMLRDYECIVTFTKVNGEVREMPCTLKDALMPVATQLISEDIVEVTAPNFSVITAWCTDKEAWRAMRTANIINVKLAPKKWIVTVESDPETGDLILPLPEELLKIQGWQPDDVLNWNDEGNGSWSLSKREVK